MDFKLVNPFPPQGDQPQAIETLARSLRAGNRYQTLEGVTGSGKTFTMANVIAQLNRPALVISHNKTLAAQLYSEFKNFFPENAVEYFVSYYDYYQPEAYIPQTDTFIEKDASINEEIERLRISATSALISRRDVIVVASVSCIYGLGSPEDFRDLRITLAPGVSLARDELLKRLVESLYERNEIELGRAKFRVRGDVVDIYPAYMQSAVRVEFFGDTVESVRPLDPLTGTLGAPMERFDLYPANQYVTPRHKIEASLPLIRKEMEDRVLEFEKQKKLIEAQRIRMRTLYDLEMLNEMGFCNGIENYSAYLSGRGLGCRPWCLVDFFPKDTLFFLDESHVTLPQIGAMYRGDRSRKERLVEYGFRLPSALDNRPLQAEEFRELTGQTIFVSATPAKTERELSSVVAEQIIRPTGLIDPQIEIRPIKGQVEDLVAEIKKAVAAQERVLVTTLTKRMSEDLADFLRENEIRVEYLHSDIDAIERVEILRRLRRGQFDVLVGVNLLREGLDLPEVALVGILDADKEGFLRSETSLIQTAGRAARHEKGRVLMYADVLTDSLRRAIETTNRRREKQIAYNEAHHITPTGVKRLEQASLQVDDGMETPDPVSLADARGDEDVATVIAELEQEMLEAADALQYEKAAILRDQIALLKSGNFLGDKKKAKKRPAPRVGRPKLKKRPK